MVDLRELLDPARLTAMCSQARAMSPAEAEAALPVLSALEKALSLRVSAVPALAPAESSPAADRLLTAAEVAQRTSLTTRWLRGRDVPFSVRVSPRCVRYSEAGMEKWIRNRKRLA